MQHLRKKIVAGDCILNQDLLHAVADEPGGSCQRIQTAQLQSIVPQNWAQICLLEIVPASECRVGKLVQGVLRYQPGSCNCVDLSQKIVSTVAHSCCTGI